MTKENKQKSPEDMTLEEDIQYIKDNWDLLSPFAKSMAEMIGIKPEKQ